MIKIPHKEKMLLRRFLKELDIRFYDLTDQEQQTRYESVVFQMLLDGLYSIQATQKEAKKENKKYKVKTLKKIKRQIKRKIFIYKHGKYIVLLFFILICTFIYYKLS